MLNQIHQFQYISIIQLAVYISSIYWYHKNLLINNFKWVTHSCIHMYVCMYVCMNVWMYVCMCVCIILKLIKLYCRHATYIYWYSTVTYGDWGVVLFFITLTNLLVFTNQLTFLFPPSVHTVFSYMCLWAGERKGLLLCSVMTAVTVPSKNCLGTAVCCEGCKTEHNQAVPHSVWP